MSIVRRPSVGASMLGGSIHAPVNPCRHAEAHLVHRWTGEEGTAGIVAVVGAGKMGLPLAAQFASHGFQRMAVIAAVGTRAYYLERGFERGKLYLVKPL